MIPAQRDRAPTREVVACASFFQRLGIGPKVLTNPLQDLLGSNRRRPFPFLCVILWQAFSLIPVILQLAQKPFPTQDLLPLHRFERIFNLSHQRLFHPATILPTLPALTNK